MSVSISQPSILAQDDRQALLQVKSYLFQLSQQLNYAFSVVDGQIATASAAVEQSVKSSRSQDPENTFLAIKGLIIKSADIVNAYSEAIEQKLQGEYVAQSAFGTYKEQTEAAIQANSKNINTVFTNVQEMMDRQIASEGYIRTGLLDYKETGEGIYGVEVGQQDTVDGQKVFSKFARFSADKLSFYDANDTEVAYISDYRMHITNAEITGSLYMLNRFRIYYGGGLAFEWLGG